ncbi:hypothetical protein AB8Q40_26940, partial [Klebsiella quasipneumoniae subsp. similipneumoniae]|uniref:hypothetical protein n=1 Tax=Klebsiella quasipneumoniae TaxID=1463165 RepID=UPI0038CF8A9B
MFFISSSQAIKTPKSDIRRDENDAPQRGVSHYSSLFLWKPSLITVASIFSLFTSIGVKEGANKQVISSQADSLIKISRIWADFFPANTSNQPI